MSGSNYNSSRHSRLYACSDCGEGFYEYGYHSTTSEYSQYSAAQQKVGSYCSTCSSYIGSTTYESHDFSYGSWTNYSGRQHRRSVYCYDCGYSSYEYASHSLSYGSWTSSGSSQHKRTVSCSCGYSTTETSSHNLTYGSWTNYSASQHKRTISCSGCSYSGTEYADYSISTGNWTSISDSEHRRTASCDCGYSGYVYEDHEHTTESGTEPIDESQHNILYACDCGHTAGEPEDHTFSYGNWTEFSASEHGREVSCECGYSGEEYDDHTDDDSDGFCDICDAVTSRFSVTLPAVMTIVVSGDGEVYAADNVAIINNSTDRIIVSSVTVSAGDNWTLAPYDYNMANEKVDSRLIGFSLNGLCTTSFGDSEIFEPIGGWIVNTNTPYTLDYDAVVSATLDVIRNEQVLTLVFIVEWLLL